ncbi:HNH endonuclease [Arthrobacter sp. Br18]|uniref:HNH endonuclease n=1 Tax=Arthrobacter sp. Br18 TaxID=1312954 RepID=UPI00047915F8|nr:HNH endonuclease [Arthrobacter sp. Br18]
MTAILLGWNPDHGNSWEPNYPVVRDRLFRCGTVRKRWSVRGLMHGAADADAWLVLQGTGTGGLIGHGVVASAVVEDIDDGPCVDVEFDALLDPGDHVRLHELAALLPAVPWEAASLSGRHLTEAEETAIRGLWEDHRPLDDIDPILPVPGAYPQAALTRVSMNRYERDPEARRICLAQHGFSCAVCRFDFEAAYGPIGRGFISIHHLVPASQLSSGYELDPIQDLLPLCPNCHAMAHRRGVALTPAELRRMMSGAGFVEGSVVTQNQLDSQAGARKLLGESSPH